MNPDNGMMPPENEVGPRGDPEGTDDTITASHRQETGYAHSSATSRQWRRGATVGRYAHAWRDGFTRGALDALRVAQREIDDPHAWLLLSRLADRYDVDPDEFELCGGGQ